MCSNLVQNISLYNIYIRIFLANVSEAWKLLKKHEITNLTFMAKVFT